MKIFILWCKQFEKIFQWYQRHKTLVLFKVKVACLVLVMVIDQLSVNGKKRSSHNIKDIELFFFILLTYKRFSYTLMTIRNNSNIMIQIIVNDLNDTTKQWHKTRTGQYKLIWMNQQKFATLYTKQIFMHLVEFSYYSTNTYSCNIEVERT